MNVYQLNITSNGPDEVRASNGTGTEEAMRYESTYAGAYAAQPGNKKATGLGWLFACKPLISKA
jgi:hypothetical protein